MHLLSNLFGLCWGSFENTSAPDANRLWKPGIQRLDALLAAVKPPREFSRGVRTSSSFNLIKSSEKKVLTDVNDSLTRGGCSKPRPNRFQNMMLYFLPIFAPQVCNPAQCICFALLATAIYKVSQQRSPPDDVVEEADTLIRAFVTALPYAFSGISACVNNRLLIRRYAHTDLEHSCSSASLPRRAQPRDLLGVCPLVIRKVFYAHARPCTNSNDDVEA